MFERFTDRARRVVVMAQQVARERKATKIGSEHVLLALHDVPGNLGLAVLEAFSITREQVEQDLAARESGTLGQADAERLATLGIDLDAVRRQVEQSFGPGALDRAADRRRPGSRGHIPFDKGAKKVLELALREALRMKHNYIGLEHVVLGMMHDGTGVAGEIIALRAVPEGQGIAAGGGNVRLDAARVIVEELTRRRDAG